MKAKASCYIPMATRREPTTVACVYTWSGLHSTLRQSFAWVSHVTGAILMIRLAGVRVIIVCSSSSTRSSSSSIGSKQHLLNFVLFLVCASICEFSFRFRADDPRSSAASVVFDSKRTGLCGVVSARAESFGAKKKQQETRNGNICSSFHRNGNRADISLFWFESPVDAGVMETGRVTTHEFESHGS